MNSGNPPVLVPVPDMLMTLGLVALLPASQLGMGALDRVTITSGAGPVGHPARAVMVVVMGMAGADWLGGVKGLLWREGGGGLWRGEG